MNVNAIFDRTLATWAKINQSIHRNQSIKKVKIRKKKKVNFWKKTHHIDEILKGDGRRTTGSVVVVVTAATTTTAAALVVFLFLVELLLQVKFLLQLLDLVWLNVLTKFRWPQGPAEILPRNLSKTFRIELRRIWKKKTKN